MAFHPDPRTVPFPVASGTHNLYLIFVEMVLDKMPQFTITSAPEDPYVSIHIRQVGDFTRGLGDRLGVGPSVVASMTQAAMKGAEKDEKSGMSRGDYVELDPAGSSITLPAVRIDGPYGAPVEDVFGAEVAILIGAGIGECLKRVEWIVIYADEGVTPFASILKHIWYRQKKGKLGSLRRVEFFWVCRDAPSFGWFQSLLQEVEAAQANRELHVLAGLQILCFFLLLISQFFAYQRVPNAKDQRGHALEHRCQ